MSEYRGSYEPDPREAEPESAITWPGQTCLICGDTDVRWTCRLRPANPSVGVALLDRVPPRHRPTP